MKQKRRQNKNSAVFFIELYSLNNMIFIFIYSVTRNNATYTG